MNQIPQFNLYNNTTCTVTTRTMTPRTLNSTAIFIIMTLLVYSFVHPTISTVTPPIFHSNDINPHIHPSTTNVPSSIDSTIAINQEMLPPPPQNTNSNHGTEYTYVDLSSPWGILTFVMMCIVGIASVSIVWLTWKLLLRRRHRQLRERQREERGLQC